MDERLRELLKIKNKYLRWGITALFAAVIAFADVRYNGGILSGIVLPLGGIFMGPAAAAGFVAGNGLVGWIRAGNSTVFAYMLSSFGISFVPWLFRNYVKDIEDPGIVLKYYLVLAVSVLTSVAFDGLCCLMPGDDPNITYDISVGMEVLCTGYPIGFPIYCLVRSRLDKKRQRPHYVVRMFCLWMPVQFGITNWFAYRAFDIAKVSDIYLKWIMLNLVLAVFFGVTAVLVLLFCRRKRLMLNIFTIMLTASTIYNFFHFDAGLGTFVLAVISLWLALHAIRFPAYEEKMAASKAFKITVRAAQSALALLFTLIIALSAAGYGIPMADGNEAGMIILGAPVRGDKASMILTDRIAAAADFLNRHTEMPVIATGGTKAEGRKTEAQVIAEGLESRGVSPERIFQETKAKTTQQNFANCAALIAQAGGSAHDPYVIATSEFHMLRSGIYARRAGFTDLHYLGAPSFVMKSLTWYIREVLAILPLVF